MKTIAGACFLAAANNSLIRLAPTPTYTAKDALHKLNRSKGKEEERVKKTHFRQIHYH